MTVSGLMESLKASVSRPGKITDDMKDSGFKANQLVKESRHTKMVQIRKVSGMMESSQSSRK